MGKEEAKISLFTDNINYLKGAVIEMGLGGVVSDPPSPGLLSKSP